MIFGQLEINVNVSECFKKSDDTELNSDTVEVLQLYSNLSLCEERNSTEHIESKNSSSAVCKSCEDEYLKLNKFYNEHGAHKFCMDIVDMVSVFHYEILSVQLKLG